MKCKQYYRVLFALVTEFLKHLMVRTVIKSNLKCAYKSYIVGLNITRNSTDTDQVQLSIINNNTN